MVLDRKTHIMKMLILSKCIYKCNIISIKIISSLGMAIKQKE